MDYLDPVGTNERGEKVLFRKPDEAWLLVRDVDNFAVGVIRDIRHAVNILIHHYYTSNIDEVRVTAHRNIREGQTIYFKDGTQKFGRTPHTEEWVELEAYGPSSGMTKFKMKKIVSLL